MYGKHFSSMYEGSLYGSGIAIFAVMGYVIANAQPDGEIGTQVELNPKKLADTLGGTLDEVTGAIEKLCAEDPESRSKEEGGRRLVRVGQYSYRVVNGAKYRAVRDEEKRRQTFRDSQRRHREKGRQACLPPGQGRQVTAGVESERERQYVRKYGDGDPGVCEVGGQAGPPTACLPPEQGRQAPAGQAG